MASERLKRCDLLACIFIIIVIIVIIIIIIIIIIDIVIVIVIIIIIIIKQKGFVFRIENLYWNTSFRLHLGIFVKWCRTFCHVIMLMKYHVLTPCFLKTRVSCSETPCI